MSTKPQQSVLLNAIDLDAYEWLSHHAPIYLEAIEVEMSRGMTPEQIRNFMLRNVGPERSGLALRLEQASRHILRMRE